MADETKDAKKKATKKTGDEVDKKVEKKVDDKATDKKSEAKKKTDAKATEKQADAKKKTDAKKKVDTKKKTDEKKSDTPRPHAPGSSRWVVPTFITVGLLGVLWMVLFYLSNTAGFTVPVMSEIGYWNLAIGMGLLAVALGLTTQWK